MGISLNQRHPNQANRRFSEFLLWCHLSSFSRFELRDLLKKATYLLSSRELTKATALRKNDHQQWIVQQSRCCQKLFKCPTRVINSLIYDLVTLLEKQSPPGIWTQQNDYRSKSALNELSKSSTFWFITLYGWRCYSLLHKRCFKQKLD